MKAYSTFWKVKTIVIILENDYNIYIIDTEMWLQHYKFPSLMSTDPINMEDKMKP